MNLSTLIFIGIELSWKTFESNVLSTLNLLDWINSQGHEKTIPLVYAGSSSFHGGVYKNPYTFSKWQGEELVKMYNKIYDIN